MADTTFVNGVTLTDADWFNDVNRLHYTIFSDPANAVTALANLSAVPPGQGILLNGQIVTSVGSNALTVAIKGADGNDPSSTNPVSVAFRSATLTTSGYTIRKITAALSLVVSSGSTLGHASALACHLFVYLIDNSGTVELAVSNLPPDYPGTFANTRLISTTAEGGAGAADSASGIYSTTARSNVPWVCVAKLKSTQATAGTWASAMTQVDQAPFVIPTCQFSVTRSGAQTMGLGAWTKVQFNQEEYDSDGTWDATTNYRHQPNVAGVYTYCLSAGITAINIDKQYAAGLYGNGTLMSTDIAHSSVVASVHGNVTVRLMMNGTSDYVDGRFFNGDTSDQSIDTAGYTRMSGGRVSNAENT